MRIILITQTLEALIRPFAPPCENAHVERVAYSTGAGGCGGRCTEGILSSFVAGNVFPSGRFASGHPANVGWLILVLLLQPEARHLAER